MNIYPVMIHGRVADQHKSHLSQNDEVYRASQLVLGWTDEWVEYLDYISKIDISHETATTI